MPAPQVPSRVRCSLMALAVLTLTTLSHAAPVIFEESVNIGPPDFYQFSSLMALEGDHLLVMGTRSDGNAAEPYYAVFHYQRQSSGYWTLQGRVTTAETAYANPYPALSMDANIAVFTAEYGQLQVLERGATGWTVTPLTIPREYASTWASDVKVVNGTIAAGARSLQCRVVLFQKNAAGIWDVTQVLPGPSCENQDADGIGPDIEFTGTQTYQHDFQNAFISDLVNGSWQTSPTAVGRALTFNSEIALRSASSVLSAGDIEYLTRRDASGAWSLRNALRSEEAYSDVRPYTRFNDYDYPADIAVRGNRAFAMAPHNDLRGNDTGSVNVFVRPSGTAFVHAATLVTSVGKIRGGLAVNDAGTRVATLGEDFDGRQGIYLFEIPTTLPQSIRVQDDFEDLNAAGWSPWGSTNWNVVTSGGSQVYRQTNVQGDARAILDAPVSQNQSIQADVTLNPAGTTSWGGLMVRYTDSRNFYYLLAAPGKPLELRQIVGGAYQAFASTPFNMTPGRSYRLRLEAIGTRIRAYVDDKLALEARSSFHTQGRAGLIMWKSRADYDNVVVSTSPLTVLHKDSFDQSEEERLTPWATGPGSWSYLTTSTAQTVFQQTASTGDARAVNGATAADQIVSADVTPVSFNTNGWVGLMARYNDNRNYYYVLLTRDGRASLRTWVDGRITVIDEAQMPVQAGTPYRVRFEAVGTSLRLYVNGLLMAEGSSLALPTGRYGVVTYRATAQFDNFSALRP